MDGGAPGRCQRGFTLTELLTVIGLVALLVALFLPVLSRVRATASSATCLSNLKQIGTAWTTSLADEHGRLPQYIWHNPETADDAWKGYWTAAMDRYDVAGRTLCPSAAEPVATGDSRGYGSAINAWTGRYEFIGTAIRLNAETCRTSSYGYNRWMTAGGGFGRGGAAAYLRDVRNPSNVPVFMDCAYADSRPLNGTTSTPVEPPPTLTGDRAVPGAPEHWKFLLARHGRGVNVYRADGGAAWVRVEDLYLLQWKDGWTPYRLSLPRH